MSYLVDCYKKVGWFRSLLYSDDEVYRVEERIGIFVFWGLIGCWGEVRCRLKGNYRRGGLNWW